MAERPDPRARVALRRDRQAGGRDDVRRRQGDHPGACAGASAVRDRPRVRGRGRRDGRGRDPHRARRPGGRAVAHRLRALRPLPRRPFAHCRTVPYMAMFGAPIGGEWGGLFSDLVRVPYADAMLVPLPPGLDPIAMASASDNWSLAWRLVGPHLAERPGGTVLILNGGSIGLYACDIAGRARRLAAAVRRPRSRAARDRRGLRRRDRRDDRSRSTTASTSPSRRPAAWRRSQPLVARWSPKGSARAPATTSSPGELPLFEMYLNSVNLRIARDNVRANIPPALDLAQSGQGRSPQGRLPRPRLGDAARGVARAAHQARLRPRARHRRALMPGSGERDDCLDFDRHAERQLAGADR